MQEEIILPDNYTGTLEQENDVISKINKKFYDIEKSIDRLGDGKIEFTKHVVDFEEYEIDLYYSDNKSKVSIVLDDDIVVVKIADKEIRINRDGDII